MAGLLVVAEVESVQYSFTCILTLRLDRACQVMSEGALDQLAQPRLHG